MSSCDEIVAALVAIQVAVEGLDVSSDLQVAIQTNIENNITVVATAIAESLATQSTLLVAASSSSASASASAFAWSQAIAQTFVGVSIINNVELQIRTLQPTVEPPPSATEEGPTGITSVTQDMSDDEICRRAFWIIYTAQRLFDFLNQGKDLLRFTVLSSAGLLGDAIGAVAELIAGGTRTAIIPASVLVQVAHILDQMQEEGILGQALTDIDDWLTSDILVLWCSLFNMADAVASTQMMQDTIVASAATSGITGLAAGLLRLVFNLNTLGTMYYVSPLQDAPSIHPSFPPNCNFCAG